MTALPAGIKNNITQCIGNTPLVQFRKVTEGCVATIAGKLENMNPLWSVKDRIAKSMIDLGTDAYCEEHGLEALHRLDFHQLASSTFEPDTHDATKPETLED